MSATPTSRRSPFTALRHRDYRWFYIGQLFSLIGTWVQSTGQNWLVTLLSESESHASKWLGIVAVLGALPMFLGAFVGGAIADRMPKRNLILSMQVIQCILALTMGLLVITGHIKLWHIPIFAGLLGITQVFDMPARQAFLSELVGKEDLSNAIGLNSSMFNGARVIGPLVAAALLRQAHRAFIVADSRLPSSHILAAAESLKSVGLPSRVLAFKPSEADKSLASLERILIDLAKAKLERDDPIIAMGGGIVGDLAGFAAAVYRRGIPVVQCPTTLLSMVDASVGGKTGVNLDMGDGPLADLKKNLIGSFHQPRLVVADIDTLRSLPPRTLHCGLAECIKHGVLGADTGDPNLLDWTESNLPAMLAGDAG